MLPLQKKSDGSIRSAPLVFFMSGMFSQLGAGRSKALVKIFGQDDAHIVYFPNPWGKLFIETKPQKLPGDLLFEAKLAMKSIEVYLKKFRKKANVEKVYLFGESYGGLLAMFMSYLDSKKGELTFNGGVRILSAPLHFQNALKNLDSILDQEQASFEDFSWWKKLNVVSDFLFASSGDDLSSYSRSHARALMSYMGFNRKLFEAYQAIESVHKLNLIPKNLSESGLEQWKNKLRFLHYFKTVHKNALGLFPGNKAFLHHWYRKTQENGFWNIKFVTAKDDFLNQGMKEYWMKFEDDVLILDRGGHSGYLALDWFQKLRGHLF